MPQLPSKLQSGDDFRGATVRTVNNIIDYLNSQRIKGDNRTIQVNQYATGLTISSIGTITNKPTISTGSSFKHPFQIYITTDENGNPQACMREGRVLVQQMTNTIFYQRFEKVSEGDKGSQPYADYIPINWADADDGDYCVVIIIKNDEDNISEYSDIDTIVCYNMMVQHLPCVSGFYSIYVGTIIKSTVENPKEGEPAYRLTTGTQRITSDIIIDDYNQNLPFTIKAFVDYGENTEVKTSASDFIVKQLKLNGGKIYDDTYMQCVYVTDEKKYKPANGENTAYLKIYNSKDNEGNETQNYEILWTNEPIAPYVQENGILTERYIMLARFFNEVPVAFFNYYPADILLGKEDTYKVLATSPDNQLGDKLPDYLVNKIAGDEGTISGDEEWKIGEGEQASTPKGYIGIYDKKNTFADEENLSDNNRLLYAKWLYNKIGGFSGKYTTLNCKESIPKWESMGMIRVANDDEEPAGFLPEKVKGGDHINTKVEEKQLVINAEPPNITGTAPIIVDNTADEGAEAGAAKWNFNVKIDKSEFVTGLTGGECITVSAGEQEEGTEASETGKSFTIGIDLDCILGKLKINGGDCISVNNGDDGYVINANIDCIFDHLSIAGESPILVSGSGASWSIAFDDSKFIKNIQGNECISVSRSGNSATVSADINCIFSNLHINGNNPILVSGSGSSWTIGFDDSKLVENVKGSNCINAERSGKTITVSADINCILGELSIVGDEYISVTRNRNTFNLEFDDTNIYKVKVSGLDSPGYLETKFDNSHTIGFYPENSFIRFGVLSRILQSPQESITINPIMDQNELNYFEVESNGKVKTTERADLMFLIDCFSDNGNISFVSEGGLVIDGTINEGLITSEKENIIIEEKEQDLKRIFDLSVDWTKVEIDPSLASLIEADYSDDTKVVLKLKEVENGVLIGQNGQIQILAAPAKSVLATDESGNFTWLEYDDCENACGGE